MDPIGRLMGLRYKSHPWHGVDIGPEAPEVIISFIEMVSTDTVKYEVDKVSGYLRLDRPQKYSNVVPNAMIKEKSAGLVLYRKEGEKKLYLLLMYNEGHWDFVKGHVEEGESDEQTYKRELFEETRLSEIEVKEGFCEKIHYTYKRSGKEYEKDVFFYLAKTEEAKVILSLEHIDYAWLEFEDALKRLTYNNAKEVLKKAEEFTSC